MRRPNYLIFNEDSVEQLLNIIGKAEEVRRGRIQCSGCNMMIKLSSLRVVYPNNGLFDFICDKPICFDRYLSVNGSKY
jgi:hypothetical protein